MWWSQSHLNAIFDAGATIDNKEVGGARGDIFDRAFGKDVRVMLNMRQSSREKLRARMGRQCGEATRIIQRWYGSLEIVDKECAKDRPVRPDMGP